MGSHAGNKKPRDVMQGAPVVRFQIKWNSKDDAVYRCTHITDNILLEYADM
jgi:hypothetical protein